MKVCSLYGAGFYYIPGTDTCIKLGGFLRTEWNHNAGGSFNVSGFLGGGAGSRTREDSSLISRTRAVVTLDTRTQTEYGTLRSYIAAGWDWTTGAAGGAAGPGNTTPYLYRGFVQFAGFTFGRTTSFFDHYVTPMYSHQTNLLGSDTGGGGINVGAYTAQFGNGVSATLSLEESTQRRYAVVDLSAGAFAPGTGNGYDNAGQRVPDIVAALRVDQAWGSAQIMGALHQNQANYYGPGNNTTAGGPGDKWGWAVGAGLTLKMPWNARDTFSVQAAYAEGATRYTAAGLTGTWSLAHHNKQAIGWIDDAYFNTGTGLELSQSWSVVAGFQHYWTPALRTSLYGGYFDYEANSSLVDARCAAGTAITGIAVSLGAGCTDSSMWQVGSRTIWNPVANLDIGVDIMYSKVQTAAGGQNIPAIAPNAGTYVTGDTGIWSGIFRVQRNFWP